MAVCHVGETWGVQSLSMAIVYLASLVACTRHKTGATSVPLTELPFGFPGHVFRSPMPFGPYDLHGEVYDRWCVEQIAVIVLLAPCHTNAGTSCAPFARIDIQPINIRFVHG